MRLYLAGPMTGIPDLNFPAFRAEAARLRALGHQVISPAELCSDIAGDWPACMRRDIVALVGCQAIALLDGWQDSNGATLEHHIAARIGMTVYLAKSITWPAERRHQ